MWHKNTRNLPTVTGEIMDSFVKKQAIAKETSVRGYKFFWKAIFTIWKVCNTGER